MRISEIFYSVQGEGELTGVPSVFIRTSGCNLRCTWCDTPYASWNPEGVEMSVDQIVAQVLEFPCSHVVLTGGEPMVAKGIHDLAARLRDHQKHITIETAGTVPPEGIACDLASISPKLANSTPPPEQGGQAWTDRHEKTRLQPVVLRQWLTTYPFQLKFVVSDPIQLEEIKILTNDLALNLPAWKILLMPEGISVEQLQGRHQWLLEACKAHGFRFCQRLHIELFGNTRDT